ncbi:MAG: hypothetical protein BGO84_05800 [Dysgonomonas sp. 37-18]|nr:MAG: hypothetical protein BGO84_05800 [Dysgonomonas sp. 37-18]
MLSKKNPVIFDRIPYILVVLIHSKFLIQNPVLLSKVKVKKEKVCIRKNIHSNACCFKCDYKSNIFLNIASISFFFYSENCKNEDL